jgi:hypothetical protein
MFIRIRINKTFVKVGATLTKVKMILYHGESFNLARDFMEFRNGAFLASVHVSVYIGLSGFAIDVSEFYVMGFTVPVGNFDNKNVFHFIFFLLLVAIVPASDCNGADTIFDFIAFDAGMIPERTVNVKVAFYFFFYLGNCADNFGDYI